MRRAKRIVLTLAVTAAAVAGATSVAWALRGNVSRDVDRLVQMGRYDEALFYHESTMVMVRSLHVRWSGAAYDPRGDEVYFQTRTDRRYWNIVHAQKRAIEAIEAKATLTAAQRTRLDERVRVYVEDHLSPDFDEMGNFYFARQAEIFEQTGMFYDASFRRQLTGQYMLRVCAPYYETMAERLRQQGQTKRGDAYARAAESWKARAADEFRRANGDRQMPGGDRRHLPPAAVAKALAAASASSNPDVAFAAAAILRDRDGAAPATPSPAGLKPGVRAAYFSDPSQDRPTAEKTLPAVEIGLTGNERFVQKLRPFWTRPTPVPANAAGPFLVRFTGLLNIPADGTYRFYVKTDNGNRATVRLTPPGGATMTAISPANDKLLLFADQVGTQSRVDFSLPIELKRGLVELSIDYKGAEARGKFGPPGLRLYWSSDEMVMQPTPPAALFHKESP